VICGFGIEGYGLAIDGAAALLLPAVREAAAAAR
jgi:3-dehydroquinate dehydratase